MRRGAVCPLHGTAPLCACDAAAVMRGVAGFARLHRRLVQFRAGDHLHRPHRRRMGAPEAVKLERDRKMHSCTLVAKLLPRRGAGGDTGRRLLL